MRNRFYAAITLLIVIVAAAGLIFHLHSLSENPLYKGRRVSWWIHAISLTPASKEAVDNWPDWRDSRAFPIILGGLRTRDNALKRAYRKLWPKLPAWLKRDLMQPVDPQTTRYKALLLLNPARDNNLALAAPALIDILKKDEPPLHRQLAASWLGSVPSTNKVVAEALIAALKDPDPQVRRTSISSLVQLGCRSEAATAGIQSLVHSNDPMDQKAATEALHILQPSTNSQPPAP